MSLFSTSSEMAGFRLHRLEVYNWGTFHERIWSISPQGNNSLLTGANASGKSTLIDALLTLLVPTKKDRFYNQSSGADKKGDRTEETYVLGHYGNIQQDGESSLITQKLRDKNTYSIILANFENTDTSIITLFQVRWFTNEGLKRSFGISRRPLEIKKDFENFDSKGNWKKLLEKRYNSNSTKKLIDFFSGPVDYGERVWKLFGMRSEKGLSLFNQIVGVKVLDDLDEFIRTNMLEGKEAENEYIQLNESFSTLMSAKINIDKTKEQIKQLQPIDEIAESLYKIQEKIDNLQKIQEIGEYWFSEKRIELAERELKSYRVRLENLDSDLKVISENEEELKDEESRLRVAIEKDEVGNKIKDIEKCICYIIRCFFCNFSFFPLLTFLVIYLLFNYIYWFFAIDALMWTMFVVINHVLYQFFLQLFKGIKYSAFNKVFMDSPPKSLHLAIGLRTIWSSKSLFNSDFL